MTDDGTLRPRAEPDRTTFELEDMEATPTDELLLEIVDPNTRGHYVHPNIEKMEVWLNNGIVHVRLPLMPEHDSISYETHELGPNTWTRLTDSYGNPLPISLFREGDLRIFGRWS